jgi:hypothetical protein
MLPFGVATKPRTFTPSLTSRKEIPNALSPAEEALTKYVQDVREGLT